MLALLALGLIALPFSSGAGAGSVVVSYGLPMFAVLGAVFCGELLVRPTVPRDTVLPLVAGFALVVALVLGMFTAPEPIATAARIVPNALGFVLFAYVLSADFADSRRPAHETLSTLIVLSGGVTAGYFVLRFATAVATYGLPAVVVDRMTGGVYSLPWGASNVVASPLIFPLFLSFYESRPSAPALQRGMAVVARVLMFAAIGVALSRGANVAVAVGLVLCFLILPPRGRRRLLVFIVLFFIALVIADWKSGGVLHEQAMDAFFGRFSTADVSDLNGRTEIWNKFTDAFTSHPLLGIGYYASEYLLGSTGHNFVLTSLAERGLIGTALSTVVLAVSAAYAALAWLRARRPDDRLFAGLFIVAGLASVLHLLVEDANFTQQYMILSWLELALPMLMWRQLGASAEEPSFSSAVPIPVPT